MLLNIESLNKQIKEGNNTIKSLEKSIKEQAIDANKIIANLEKENKELKDNNEKISNSLMYKRNRGK